MKNWYKIEIIDYIDHTEVRHNYPGEIDYMVYNYEYYSRTGGDEIYYLEEKKNVVRNFFELYDHDEYNYDEKHLLLDIEDLEIDIIRNKRFSPLKGGKGTIYLRKKEGKWNAIMEMEEMEDTLEYTIMCNRCIYSFSNVEVRICGYENISPEECCEEPEDAKEFLEMIKKEKEKEKSP